MAEEAENTTEEMVQESSEEQSSPDTSSQHEAEIAKYKDMYLRAMAETENVRTRAKRENEDTAKYATTKFSRDMVNVLENLSRAHASISEEAKAASDVVRNVAEGIDMTIKELVGIFERNGIKRLDPFGEKFDHNFHQAVAQVESSEAEPGTILQVLQAGYVLHDRLLRPAMVTVATAKKENDAA